MIVRRDGRDAARRQAPHGEDDRDRRPASIRRNASGAVPRAGDDDQAGDALLHHRFQHLLPAAPGFSAVLAMNGTMPADWKTRSMPTASSAIEGVGQVVDDHADDVGLRLAQVGRAAIVDVADSSMALRTLPAVSGRIRPLPCSTSDTVDFDTPASRAISRIVALSRAATLVLRVIFPRIIGTF